MGLGILGLSWVYIGILENTLATNYYYSGFGV